ncbi:MAG: hypothetical protein Q7S86_03745 [bacterium]|nr:hypothetical protein [bacterium]
MMGMTLINLTNEIVVFVAQVVTTIFSIGIAVYIFQFPIWKENVVKAKEIVMGQHQRVSRNIIKLFFTGVGTILYAIVVRIITSQVVPTECVLWFLLGGSIILLLLTFYLLYSIFPVIGLIDR